MKSSVRNLYSDGFPELAVRIFLGSIFAFAAIHKIANPSQFALILYGYDLFPEYTINFVALVIPWLELLTGIGLIVGFRPRASSLLLGILLFCFIIALSINLYRGHEFDCGCFSFGDVTNIDAIRRLVARDVLYLSLSLLIFCYGGRRRFCLL